MPSLELFVFCLVILNHSLQQSHYLFYLIILPMNRLVHSVRCWGQDLTAGISKPNNPWPHPRLWAGQIQGPYPTTRTWTLWFLLVCSLCLYFHMMFIYFFNSSLSWYQGQPKERCCFTATALRLLQQIPQLRAGSRGWLYEGRVGKSVLCQAAVNGLPPPWSQESRKPGARGPVSTLRCGANREKLCRDDLMVSGGRESEQNQATFVLDLKGWVGILDKSSDRLLRQIKEWVEKR